MIGEENCKFINVNMKELFKLEWPNLLFLDLSKNDMNIADTEIT